MLASLSACDRGPQACEEAIKGKLAQPDSYEKISVTHEPGETPAMTYYVIDYYTRGPDGLKVRERVHCSYMPDFDEAAPHLLQSVRTQ